MTFPPTQRLTYGITQTESVDAEGKRENEKICERNLFNRFHSLKNRPELDWKHVVWNLGWNSIFQLPLLGRAGF